MPDFDWVRIVDAFGIGLVAGLLVGLIALVRLLVNFIVDWTAALFFNRDPKAQLTDRTGQTD
jgi:hypothetical protein